MYSQSRSVAREFVLDTRFAHYIKLACPTCGVQKLRRSRSEALDPRRLALLAGSGYYLGPCSLRRCTQSCESCSTRSPRAGATKRSSRLRCSCFGAKSRCSSGRSSGSNGRRPIGWCWPPSVIACQEAPGQLCGYSPRLSWDGIATLFDGGGRVIDNARVEEGRHFRQNAESSSSEWRARTRGGAISGFEASY